MKIYSDTDILFKVDGVIIGDGHGGTESVLETAKRIKVTFLGSRGTIVEKEAKMFVSDDDEIDDGKDTILVHLTPSETALLGVGDVAMEATVVTRDGMQVKTSTATLTMSDAIDKEVLDV